MALRYILPTLAVAGSAAAASCSGTTTIVNQAQATQVAACNQWDGTIVIGGSASGSLDFSGIQRIDGSLMAHTVQNLQSLSASTLSEISGTFELDVVSSLDTLDFPSLVAVDTVSWTGLPQLMGLSFDQTLQTASSISIINTALNTLNGINLTQIGVLSIQDNPQLTEINMPQLTNITNELTIASNGQGGGQYTAVSFAGLLSAANLTVQNVQSIDLSQLSYVSGGAGFRSNECSNISLPNLSAVGDGLTFAANSELTSLSVPELTEVRGGVVVANNTKLDTIDGFPRLSKLFGNIDFLGSFTSVTLPKLSYVEGAFYVASSGNIQSSCNHFQTEKSNGVIQGLYTCTPNEGKASSEGGSLNGSGGSGSGSSGSSSGSSSSSSSSGKSGANSLIIPYATGVIGVVAAIFGML